MHDPLPLLAATDLPPIRRRRLDTLQVRLGDRGSQSGLHCHVAAGPQRTEMRGGPQARVAAAGFGHALSAAPVPARLSIIVPTLNEAAGIVQALAGLQPLRERGAEVLVVDGGSHDGTAALAGAHADAVLTSLPGRARQMNAGAAAARGDILLFLHADTRLPAQADALLRAALAGGAGRADWGRFDVVIDGRPRLLKVVASMMNTRSRWTGIATGDQAIFVRRSVFDAVGGFPDQPLMEDIELSRRLRRVGRPACLRQRVVTSGRRWEARGVWRTIFLMWRLRWRYWRGEPPERLAQAYR